MHDDLERLLRDVSLVTLAFGIAIGWSLYQFAHGVATFVDGLVTHLPASETNGFSPIPGGGLTWVVGHRIVALDGIVIALIQLAVVLALAAFLRRRSRPQHA